MNMKEFITEVNGHEYIKDSQTDTAYLVVSVEYVSSVPSDGKENTVYLLSDGSVFHRANMVLRKIEPVAIKEKKVEVPNKVKQETTPKDKE